MGCAAAAAHAALTAALLTLMPETPSWLVTKGQLDRARASLRWLRGPASDVEGEIRALTGFGRDANAYTTGCGSVVSRMRKREVWKPLLLLLALFILMQSTGTFAIVFYAVN